MLRAMNQLLTDRRRLLQGAAALGLAGLLPAAARAAQIDTSDLSDITTQVPRIGRPERLARIERAQALMQAQGIDAILIEPGASMIYFSGVEWHRSERLTALVLPAKGECVVVTPFFEEPSVRQTLGIPAEVRVWQEDEDPFVLVADAIKDRGGARLIGIEETVRFFASDRLAKLVPGARLTSANPVVRGCRMIKAPAELALMQAATDVTIAAYRWTAPRIRENMVPSEIGALMNAATTKLGGASEFELILLGEAAAYPHGSRNPQHVKEGEVVLMDCGCTVDGYQSDVSRTFVPGKAPDDVRRVWDIVAEGQHIAMRTAQIGTPAGAVDDAVRAYYVKQGFGPGYKLPGLSHRTGHGIGLEGHEPVNLVHGETTKLAAGMCFSNEPGLYWPGHFGVRLEDCFHMTAEGPRFFSTPPESIDKPF